MISSLLIAHIILLSLSVVATTLMMVGVLLSRAAPQLIRRTTLFITGIGVAIGGILLIQHPLGSRCIELMFYVVIFSVAYRYITVRSTKLTSLQTAKISITTD